MKGKWKKIGLIGLIALLLCSCGRKAFAIFPQMSEASSSVTDLREGFPADREAAEDEVALYCWLGKNPSTRMEIQKITEEFYSVDQNHKAIMERWDVSDKQYVFIGWFFMDEEGQPTNWAGDKTVKFTKGSEKRLVAVFNIL